MAYTIKPLARDDISDFRQMNQLFGDVFEMPDDYHNTPPSDAYVRQLLSNGQFIGVVAIENDAVIGAAACFLNHKFEQERAELHVYDLAVANAHQKRGIGTAILHEIRHLAHDRGAWTVTIASEPEDEVPTKLYGKLGELTEACWFDLSPIPRG